MKLNQLRNFRPGRFRSSRRLCRVGLGAAAAAGLLASAMTTANANLIVSISEDGGAYSTVLNDAINAGPDIWGYNGTYFTIVAGGASSNSPGTSSLSKVLSSTLSVTNNGTATHTLSILIGAQDFTAPTAPPAVMVDSHIGGSVVINDPTNTASFLSCVRQSNVSATSACSGSAHITPTGTPNITSGSFSDDQYLQINSLSGPYSLSQELMLSMSGGSELNFATNTVVSPVPEPGALSLMAMGLIGLGFASRRRVRSH